MPSLPKLLIITGEAEGTFKDVWEGLISSLMAASAVTLCSDPAVSSNLLLTGEVSSVLIVSPQPFLSSKGPYRILRDRVRNFADRQGGTVLFCGLFSSFVKPTSFDSYFANEWKLPWRFGDYRRTTFAVNPRFDGNRGDGNVTSTLFDPIAAGLDRSYSQKAVHVKGAPKNLMLYITTPESKLESLVWAAEDVSDVSQSPTVFQPYGKGHVGFLGDVNGEDGTTKAILALCGLASNTTVPVVVAETEDLHGGGV